MSMLAPPPSPPRVALGDDDRLKQVHNRLWQLVLTAVTVLVTGWLCTLGPIPAIIALMVAKHVLVAIVAMGLGIDARRSVETPS